MTFVAVGSAVNVPVSLHPALSTPPQPPFATYNELSAYCNGQAPGPTDGSNLRYEICLVQQCSANPTKFSECGSKFMATAPVNICKDATEGCIMMTELNMIPQGKPICNDQDSTNKFYRNCFEKICTGNSGFPTQLQQSGLCLNYNNMYNANFTRFHDDFNNAYQWQVPPMSYSLLPLPPGLTPLSQRPPAKST